MRVLVDAAWLTANRDRVHVVDCSYKLGEPGEGRRRYLAEHIPGAAHMDMASDLSAPPEQGPGRHPLPEPEAFEAAARRAGIRNDTPVVAVDRAMEGGAARLWWLLRHHGKDDVMVLEEGLRSWPGPWASGEESIPPGDLQVRVRDDDTVDRDQVLASLSQPGRVLLDARVPERYRGEQEPIDPVAGHIPGARNVPASQPVPPELVEGDKEIVAYCGSGVSACVVLARLADAGHHDAKLYPGSWSDWSTHGLPLATGEEP